MEAGTITVQCMGTVYIRVGARFYGQMFRGMDARMCAHVYEDMVDGLL